MYIWSFIGLILVFYVAIVFFKQIGNTLPIIYLLLFISGIQWILAPFFAYRLSIQHYKYFMRVDEITYMSYVVPAFFGMLFVLRKTNNYKFTFNFDYSKYSKYGRYILLIGILSDVLRFVTPSSLLFFIYLTSLFKYVGVGLLLFSRNSLDRAFFYLAFFYLGLSALDSAMFHDLILSSTFLFFIWSLKNKLSSKTKLLFLSIGLLIMLVIQIVKSSYRDIVWNGYSGNKIELFSDVLNNILTYDYLFNDENLSEINVRMNQGWIISSVMQNVPSLTPHLKGLTIIQALEGVIVPRFLNSNKKIAGGRDNFEKYTGVTLSENTSMNLSIIGESYINFGYLGGIIFMILLMWFLSLYWIKLHSYFNKHPILLFFTPLLFFQVVKAETDLFVVLNHLLKSSFIVIIFFWITNKFFRWRI